MPQAFFFPVTYKKMRLVARINSDQVSSKTDVTTSSYEGFKFCIDARVNAYISVDARIQLARNTNLHETNLHEYSVGETRIYTKRIERFARSTKLHET